MNNFDFKNVHKTMKALDWKWGNKRGTMTIPSLTEIKKLAFELLTNVSNSNEYAAIGTGGFLASREGRYLFLDFIVSDFSSEFYDEVDLSEEGGS